MSLCKIKIINIKTQDYLFRQKQFSCCKANVKALTIKLKNVVFCLINFSTLFSLLMNFLNLAERSIFAFENKNDLKEFRRHI